MTELVDKEIKTATFNMHSMSKKKEEKYMSIIKRKMEYAKKKQSLTWKLTEWDWKHVR